MAKKKKKDLEILPEPMIAVCGLILHPDKKRLLGVSRKGNHTDFGLPGGKLEKNEVILEAIRREILEETGIVIDEPRWLMSSYDENGYFVVAFLCKPLGGIVVPVAKEPDTTVDWVTWEQIENGSFGEYNKRLHERYNSFPNVDILKGPSKLYRTRYE